MITEILILIILALTCSSMGLSIFRRLRFNFDSALEEWLFSLLLGFGLFAYSIFCFGLAGLLYKQVIALFMAALLLIFIRPAIFILSQVFVYLKQRRYRGLPHYFITVMPIIVVFSLIGAMSPLICNDSLAYRLVHVRIFSEVHKLIYIPYTRESLWPYLIEMLFTAGLLLKSDILVKLMAWFFGILCSILVYSFSKNNLNQRAACLSTVIFLSTPAILNQMTHAYVDIPLALYSFAALISVFKFNQKNELRWLALAGIFSGFILSIKYIGLISILAILPLILLKGNKKVKPNLLIKGLLLFLFFCVLFSFAWYLRSYMIKGNPIYPFLAKFFNNNGWIVTLESDVGSKFSWMGLILLPWNITMYPSEFGGEPFGLAYLIFLPLLFFCPKVKKINNIFLFVIIYTILWFFIDPYINRFLFPVLLPLSVLIGLAVDSLLNKNTYVLPIKAGFILVLSINIVMLFYHNIDKVKVVLGKESKADYLSRIERTYEIAEMINENVPKGSTILMVGEVRSYYIHRPYIHFNNLIKENLLDKNILDKRISVLMLERFKIDYILLRTGSNLYPLLEEYAKLAKPLFKSNFLDKDKEAYSYVVFKFSDFKNDVFSK